MPNDPHGQRKPEKLSQIADRLNRNVKTVYQAISRAHQTLAQCVRNQTARMDEVAHA